MKRKERQRKLHDSLLNLLYDPPSPPPPPPPDQNEFDEQTLTLAQEIANSDHHQINTYELEVEEGRNLSASSSEEEDESGSQKLTRAQRKRLRKKKLKEVASHRRDIIGPQLPLTEDDQIGGDGPQHQQPEGVRRNVTEGSESGNDHTIKPYSASSVSSEADNELYDKEATSSGFGYSGGETTSAIKVKHRRMSKKKARDKTKTTDLGHEATTPDHQNQAFA